MDSEIHFSNIMLLVIFHQSFAQMIKVVPEGLRT